MVIKNNFFRGADTNRGVMIARGGPGGIHRSSKFHMMYISPKNMGRGSALYTYPSTYFT